MTTKKTKQEPWFPCPFARWAVVSGLILFLGLLCLGHQSLPLLLAQHASSSLPTPTSMQCSTPSPTAFSPLGQFQAATTSIHHFSTDPIEPTPAVITLTVLYDNNPADSRLTTAWGFACLIQTADVTILFDTGGDGRILMRNMAALAIDPATIDAVVLSHSHSDHIGGLEALLRPNGHLAVYAPESFADQIRSRVGARADVVRVGRPTRLFDGIHTMGEMGSSILEQSLILEGRRGPVVVTGCAHPGIVSLAEHASAQGEIDLLIGGFHLKDHTPAQIRSVVASLRALGVRRAVPCHCTGAPAIAEFGTAFGRGYLACGAGTVITIHP